MSGIAVGAKGDLMVGDDTGDDAAVYRLSPDTALIFTVDCITPLINDAYLFGQIAAANSMSDVYAMGGKPFLALNVCAFPDEDVPQEDLNAILRGAADLARRAGCIVAGGHTIADKTIKYGLAVMGRVHPDRVKRNSTAEVGHRVILTKRIGSGVIVNGYRSRMVTDESLVATCRSMTVLNDKGADIAQEYDASALTDVTGFGLGGHALGMAKGAKVGIRLYASKVPVFPETTDLIRRGVKTGLAVSTDQAIQPYLRIGPGVSAESVALLSDPQTSGGLLMTVVRERAGQAVEALKAAGYADAAVIGEVYDSGGEPELGIEP